MGSEPSGERLNGVPVFTGDAAGPGLLERIAEHLERGGLLAYPTETVYGLGSAATDEGIAAVRGMKGREGDKPVILLVPHRPGEWIAGLEETPAARALAAAFWPGPLTLVLRDSAGGYPDGARNEAGGVAVRASPDPFVRALLDVYRRPLVSTSANVSGGAPARSVAALRGLTTRPGADRLWIADGGPRRSAVPSALVDCTGEVPVLLRPGAVAASDLAAVVPGLALPERGPGTTGPGRETRRAGV